MPMAEKARDDLVVVSSDLSKGVFIEKYTSRSSIWQRITHLPELKITSLTAICDGNNLVVLGGENTAGFPINVVIICG